MFRSIFEEWLETTYRPIIGGDGEGDEETPAGGSEENEPEVPDPAGSGEGEPEGNGDVGDEEPEEENDADLDEVERVKNERDSLRQALARAEAAAQQAKKDARKAREDLAKKGGNWEQVAKEREVELQEANERVTESEKRAILAEENLDKFQRQVRITRIATKLSFRDPEDAISQLATQPEVTGDDKSCERALRKLAESKPYLVDQRRARGRAMADGNGDTGLTFEQLKNMSTEEVNAAWESGQAQRALAHAPGGGG